MWNGFLVADISAHFGVSAFSGLTWHAEHFSTTMSLPALRASCVWWQLLHSSLLCLACGKSTGAFLAWQSAILLVSGASLAVLATTTDATPNTRTAMANGTSSFL